MNYIGLNIVMAWLGFGCFFKCFELNSISIFGDEMSWCFSLVNWRLQALHQLALGLMQTWYVD